MNEYYLGVGVCYLGEGTYAVEKLQFIKWKNIELQTTFECWRLVEITVQVLSGCQAWRESDRYSSSSSSVTSFEYLFLWTRWNILCVWRCQIVTNNTSNVKCYALLFYHKLTTDIKNNFLKYTLFDVLN